MSGVAGVGAVGVGRCLVTAGPTQEPVDEVRRLTNFSTGALGTGLANVAASAGWSVTLLRGTGSTATEPLAAVRVVPFTTALDLAERLKAEAGDDRVAVFHAAAVSDFSVAGVWEEDGAGVRRRLVSGKIPTRGRVGRLWMELGVAPKILGSMRDWFPRGWIVGWKYEVEGDADDAMAAAMRQVGECRTDRCVVNGPAWGLGFGVVDRGGLRVRAGTAMELAASLLAEARADH